MTYIQQALALLYNQRGLLRKLAQKGGLALIEQAFFSSSTFVINILLIRWLSATSYGAYTIAFAVLIFMSGFYQALIFDPIAIYGSVKYRSQFVYYSRLQFRLFCRLAGGVTVVLLIITAGLFVLNAQPDLQLAFLGISLGQGALMIMWLVRRLYYTRNQVASLMKLTAMYAILQVVILYGLHAVGLLTPFSAYLGPAVGTLFVGMLGLLLLGKPVVDSTLGILSSTDILVENWRYGNWLTLAAILNWMSNYAYFLIVGIVLSIEETGALRALQNLTLPAIQFLTATGMVFFPWAAEQFAAGGYKRLQNVTAMYTAMMAFVSSAYYLFLLVFDDILLQLLYAGSFSEYANLMPLLGIIPIMIGITSPIALAIRIGYSTLYTFFLDLSSTIVVFTVSLYLTFSGLQGTVSGMLLSNAVRIVVVLWLWRYLSMRRQSQAMLATAPTP